MMICQRSIKCIAVCLFIILSVPFSSFAGDWVQSGNDIYFDTGKVGIGMLPHPEWELAVWDKVYVESNNPSVFLHDTETPDVTWMIRNHNSDLVLSPFNTISAGNYTYPNYPVFLIDDVTGNVGIGTMTPQSKLAVNGTVTAKEVVVTADGWADYVFEDNYKIMPLNEIEEHIRAKKHLPGIPSAEEVEENGLSLGDMQAKMMAKIEELTLHMIEQNKKLERLESENLLLKKEIAGLHTQSRQ